MEDPDAEAVAAFARMTDWLRAAGLTAPGILYGGAPRGRLLVEDFGDAKLTDLIRTDPARQIALYGIAIDVLLLIRGRPTPDLPRPNAQELLDATRLADEWYPGADTGALDALRDPLAEALDDILAAPATLSLRDFHTDNILWLPERSGLARFGLLDYQDAFLIHPAYDLMSLLTDARVDVPKDVAEATFKAYAERSGDSLDDLGRAIAALGVQRNLRILGIFCRSARRDGKRQHLGALPRVRAHLAACLAHPVFAAVAAHLERAIPPDVEVPT